MTDLSDAQHQQLRALLFSLRVTVDEADQAVAAIAAIFGRGVGDGPAVTLHVDEGRVHFSGPVDLHGAHLGQGDVHNVFYDHG